MTTYDMNKVRNFVSNLNEQFCQCQNGEGMECSRLDDQLIQLSMLCYEFVSGLRAWGREVFARHAEYDSAIEEAWLSGARQLLESARKVQGDAELIDVECFVLEGHDVLGLAILDLEQLLDRWVSPKPSVGPSSRLGASLSQESVQEAQRRIELLPSLPLGWRSDDSQSCAI